MAVGVDEGVTRGWAFGARLAYVLSMILMGLHGVVGAVLALRAFAGNAPPPVAANGYLAVFTALTIALGGALWMEHAHGVPFDRSGAGVLGLLCLGLAIHPPVFLRGHAVYQGLARLVSEAGVRALYAAFGIAFLVAALTGATAGLFHD